MIFEAGPAGPVRHLGEPNSRIHEGVFMSFRLILLMMVLALALPVMADEARLMPVGDGDFAVSGNLSQVRDDVRPAAGVQGEPASVFMPARGESVSTALSAPENDSRSYSLTVTARELSAGVSLPLSASGAVLRIVPEAGGGARLLQVDDVMIRQGAWDLQGRAAARDLARGEELSQAAPVFGADTLAMRLSDRVGAGEAVLQVREAALLRGGRYQLHVFEPESPVRARLSAERPIAALGQEFAAGGQLMGAAGLAVERVQGDLISPDGRRIPVDWEAADGEDFGTRLALPRTGANSRGLWELEARLEGAGPQGPVRRDVRVAFEMVAPTARLNGAAAVAPSAEGWTVRVAVDVASPGRYEVRATLPDVGTAHAASWLEPGRQELVLQFPGSLPRQAVLEDLRLVDQSRVALLHVQQEGLAIGNQRDRDILPEARAGL
jgi:hypothetical protein